MTLCLGIGSTNATFVSLVAHIVWFLWHTCDGCRRKHTFQQEEPCTRVLHAHRPLSRSKLGAPVKWVPHPHLLLLWQPLCLLGTCRS
uniref:Putative secreted protein n=1 Tax=Ixodes ricinus TaxID=34613 RepID=A0A6B0UFF4_IXORI